MSSLLDRTADADSSQASPKLSVWLCRLHLAKETGLHCVAGLSGGVCGLEQGSRALCVEPLPLQHSPAEAKLDSPSGSSPEQVRRATGPCMRNLCGYKGHEVDADSIGATIHAYSLHKSQQCKSLSGLQLPDQLLILKFSELHVGALADSGLKEKGSPLLYRLAVKHCLRPQAA